MNFKQYVKYRENEFDMDSNGNGESDIEKINHFMLLALANQDIRGSMYPILQQIAGQDDTGELQELLKTIDINNLGGTAKKMLKSHNEKEKLPDDKRDTVKPSSADAGGGLEETD